MDANRFIGDNLTEDSGMDIDTNTMTLDELVDHLDTVGDEVGLEPISTPDISLSCDLYGTAEFVRGMRRTHSKLDLLTNQDYADAIEYLAAHRAMHLVDEG